MENKLQFGFLVDKENNTISVTKEFAASRNLVWSAWTEPDLLDLWWAPTPRRVRTKTMEFQIGGRWHYAMVGPKGEEHWSMVEFTSITPKSNFKYIATFCDSQGITNNDLPGSDWNIDFIEQPDSTCVNVTITHGNLSDLEQQMQMGFKEGFTMTLGALAILLTDKNKKYE